MSSQDRLENVLRDIHVMISKSEAYDADRIIVSKQDIFNLIDRLNVSVYDIMDDYELTQQSRDRALREHKKEGDRIIWDASRQAEDIYAASVMYTEEALNRLHVIVEEAEHTVGDLYKEFKDHIREQQKTIKENQLELKSQLQLLADTEKYLKLIEDRNKEIERERADGRDKEEEEEPHLIVKPEIRINEEYFRKAGIPLEPQEDEEEKTTEKRIEAEEEAAIEMEPLTDEGVIEETLKKAADDFRQVATAVIQEENATRQKEEKKKEEKIFVKQEKARQPAKEDEDEGEEKEKPSLLDLLMGKKR